VTLLSEPGKQKMNGFTVSSKLLMFYDIIISKAEFLKNIDINDRSPQHYKILW